MVNITLTYFAAVCDRFKFVNQWPWGRCLMKKKAEFEKSREIFPILIFKVLNWASKALEQWLTLFRKEE
jgi:hypothetical protein